MIKLYSPQNEVELAILKSLFEAEGVPIYVHTDNYGSIKPGIPFALENQKIIMVHEAFLEEATEIMRSYLSNIEYKQEQDEAEKPKYSFWAKVRMLFEGLFLGRVIPGSRRSKKEKDE